MVFYSVVDFFIVHIVFLHFNLTFEVTDTKGFLKRINIAQNDNIVVTQSHSMGHFFFVAILQHARLCHKIGENKQKQKILYERKIEKKLTFISTFIHTLLVK